MSSEIAVEQDGLDFEGEELLSHTALLPFQHILPIIVRESLLHPEGWHNVLPHGAEPPKNFHEKYFLLINYLQTLVEVGLVEKRRLGVSDGKTELQIRSCNAMLAQCISNWQLNNPVEVSDVQTAIGVVYLLKCGPHYKIGKTINIDNRLSTLKIQLPYKPELIHTITTNHIHWLEKHWHTFYREKRLNGEWFELTIEDVDYFRSMKHLDAEVV
jgi:hypothetical protein